MMLGSGFRRIAPQQWWRRHPVGRDLSTAATRIVTPRHVIIEGGSVGSRLGALVGSSLGRSRPLIVTDGFLAEKTEFVARAVDGMRAQGLDVGSRDVFTETVPDPTSASVGRLVDFVRKKGAAGREYDCLVAVGGGSPMDTAKAAAVLLEFGGAMAEYKSPRTTDAELSRLPVVAVPTTAGTGSEVTKFCVVTDSATGEKMLCAGAAFVPAAAVVDYELTLTAPARLAADTGIDALCHALEALVSAKSNWYSDAMAAASLEAIGHALRPATAGDPKARAVMARAATCAGLAFGNASVTLIHGMSRPLGAKFHVPHGLSNAVLAPAVTEFSVPGRVPGYARAARLLGVADLAHRDADAAQRLAPALHQLNADLDVPSLATACGVQRDAFTALIPDMASEALASGSPANNPVVPSVHDIAGLYAGIFDGRTQDITTPQVASL